MKKTSTLHGDLLIFNKLCHSCNECNVFLHLDKILDKKGARTMFHQPCKFAFTNLKNVKANVAKHQQVFPNSSSTFLFSSSKVEKLLKKRWLI